MKLSNTLKLFLIAFLACGVFSCTDKPKQIEAIELFNTVKDSLLKLKDLGVVLDLNKTYLINRVLIGDDRESPALKVDPTALYHTVINLK